MQAAEACEPAVSLSNSLLINFDELWKNANGKQRANEGRRELRVRTKIFDKGDQEGRECGPNNLFILFILL